MFKATQATYKIAALRKRIRAVSGGTSAGKTVAILQILIQMSQTDKVPKLTSVVSESLPHLKLGAMKDFLDIMRQHNYYKEERWSRTEYTYTFETGSQIQFFGADSPEKAHGPRRNRLFVNEANNVPWASFDQMEVRTSDIVFLDWNPTNEFWFYTDVLPSRPESIDFIKLTYRDNDALQKAIVQSIESRRGNRQWWKVYGEGELGEAEGRIYTGWAIIDEIPHEARLERYGLDFGYSVDPTVILAIYVYNGGIILDEIAYQKELSNRAIADILLNRDRAICVADSAEPKSIDEIASYGVMAIPCVKGAGSVSRGISYVQEQRISVTARSVRTIKAYRNYMWASDRDGKKLPVPDDAVHEWSNPMDAARYGIESLHPTESQEFDLPVFEPVFGRTGY